MACVRGCCPTQREHYQSLSVSSADKKNLTKTTTDDHATHTVDVIQHWNDRQDVTVHPKTLSSRATSPQE